ncbi:hypothetical protein Tco_1565760, partial [Tanacetum coccineum]
MITMSEYLRFPFLFDVSIVKGTAISANNQIEQNTTPPLPVGQPISDKIESQLEVEVEDPKVIASRKKKKAQAARTAAKKNESKKRVNCEGEGSKPKPQKRKTSAVQKDHTTCSGHVSSLIPIRRIAPTGRIMSLHSDSGEENDETQKAPENEHNSAQLSPCKSANESVHNYIDIDGGKDKESPPQIEPFVNQSDKPLNANKEEVFLSKSNAGGSSQRLSHTSIHYDSSIGAHLSQPREVLKGLNIEEGESSRPCEIYVLGW